MPSAALAQAVRLYESEPGMPLDPRSDHTQLARVLISTWALHTGRVLRGDVPPDELPVDDLIDFWADPLLADPMPDDQGWSHRSG
jgi:hypothetical protein